MWARVKGRTENDLMMLPLKAFMFRPGGIQPMHGERSSTASYHVLYALFAPLRPLLRRAFPSAFTNTEQLGRAMLSVARSGAPKPVLETADINQL